MHEGVICVTVIVQTREEGADILEQNGCSPGCC